MFGAALVMVAVSGCARYYWGKPGGTPEQFARDNAECARDALRPSAVPGQSVLIEESYRACLNARGYIREKQFDPPPAGWYRGIE